MPNYVQIIDGEIKQVAVGFDSPPFPSAIEAPDYVAENPAKWEYINGEFIEKHSGPELKLQPQPQLPPSSLEQRIADLETAVAAILGGGV